MTGGRRRAALSRGAWVSANSVARVTPEALRKDRFAKEGVPPTGTPRRTTRALLRICRPPGDGARGPNCGRARIALRPKAKQPRLGVTSASKPIKKLTSQAPVDGASG